MATKTIKKLTQDKFAKVILAMNKAKDELVENPHTYEELRNRFAPVVEGYQLNQHQLRRMAEVVGFPVRPMQGGRGSNTSLYSLEARVARIEQELGLSKNGTSETE